MLKETFSSILSLKSNLAYRIRFQVAIIIVQVLMLLFVYWQPSSWGDESERYFQNIIASDSRVVLEDVAITRQATAPAALPKPEILPTEPSDEIIETEPLDVEPYMDMELPEAETVTTGAMAGGNEGIVSNPEIPPQVRKIVEPVVPKAARKAGIKAEVRVSFLVGTDGKVQDVSISSVKVFDPNSKRMVPQEMVGYGLIEATLIAASKWRFRPAENGGNSVPTYTEHIFTYGF